jgi:hypothetical protein
MFNDSTGGILQYYPYTFRRYATIKSKKITFGIRYYLQQKNYYGWYIQPTYKYITGYSNMWDYDQGGKAKKKQHIFQARVGNQLTIRKRFLIDLALGISYGISHSNYYDVRRQAYGHDISELDERSYLITPSEYGKFKSDRIFNSTVLAPDFCFSVGYFFGKIK